MAERTAVERSSGVILISFARTAAMQVGAKLAFLALPFHGGNDLVTDDQAANVCSTGFLDELLHHEISLQAAESLDDALGGLLGFGQNHADALCTLKQFDHHRRAADKVQQVLGIVR